MNEETQNEKNSLSMSKMRKIERKKEIKKMKRNSYLSKIIAVCLIALVSVGLVYLIGSSIHRSITRVKPSSDYSAGLTENGLIKDVQVTDHLELADYSNITIPLKDVEYTDADMEKDIKDLLANEGTLETETDALIADGDKVNIDYVGTVDGKEFEGGNTNNEGTDLTIGSNEYVNGFEEQLIGHGVGDKVTVKVTFPADYTEAALAGKDAVFEVEINGIYSIPELTDAYVKENLSEYATTADEYREYLKESEYEANLDTWLEKYLIDNTTISSYPEKYINALKSIKKHEDQSYFEYMNQFYASLGSTPQYATFEQYVGMSEKQYDAGLGKEVQDQAKKLLILQAIYEKEGFNVAEDEYNKYLSDKAAEGYDSYEEMYGKGNVMQQLIREKVLDYLKEKAVIN
jgi:trigger factor